MEAYPAESIGRADDAHIVSLLSGATQAKNQDLTGPVLLLPASSPQQSWRRRSRAQWTTRDRKFPYSLFRTSQPKADADPESNIRRAEGSCSKAASPHLTLVPYSRDGADAPHGQEWRTSSIRKVQSTRPCTHKNEPV